MDNLYKSMHESAAKYASAVGHLRGVLIGMCLYDEITPSRFKNIYDQLVYSYELSGSEISEFDMKRLQDRASEIGAII